MQAEEQRRCAVARECGGCSQVTTPYEQQLAAKDARVHELFASDFPEADIRPILGMQNPYHYRNKVTSPFAPGKRTAGNTGAARNRDGKRRSRDKRPSHDKRSAASNSQSTVILTGMYAAGTHRLVQTDGCLVENQQAQQAIRAIRSIMMRHKIAPYNEDRGTGFVRHAVVRVGHESGEVLVTIVTNEDQFPSSKSFCRELVKRCPFITTIVQNVNMRQTNVILGEQERRLYGPGFILDTLCGLSFRISSRSFYQVNAVQTTVLYEQAVGFALEGLTQDAGDDRTNDAALSAEPRKQAAGPCEQSAEPVQESALSNGSRRHIEDTIDGKPCSQAEGMPPSALRSQAEGTAPLTVLDAYCGTGTIGLVAAKRGAAQVIGVDSVESAISDARENARHNGIDNARFITADASDFMREAATAGERIDVVLMDPPRAGSTPEFIEALAQLAPARVVYVSCNPETQVRDLRMFAQQGYTVRVVQPVDMFPHTDHIETVCLLAHNG